MSAKNDITGDAIQSRCLSQTGRDAWDRIFVKKSSDEWLSELYPHVTLYDADGWTIDNTSLSKPISKIEFEKRFIASLSIVTSKRT